MRLILALCILLMIESALALEARVLVDEVSVTQSVIGDFRVTCVETQNVKCDSKTHLLPFGEWVVSRRNNYLYLQSRRTGAEAYLKGQHFKMTGTISFASKPLQRLDVVFNGEQTEWIAHLPIDQYLYGVMTAEVPASWPLEALKAQAVASRTYFLFKKKERMKHYYDVRSDIMDQVFKMDGKKYKSIMQAVQQTHGLVLVSNEDDKVFPAYFHSDCGGSTSSEANVWRKPTSLNQRVQDPYCRTANKNNWSYNIDRTKLMELLHRQFYLPKDVELLAILPRIEGEKRAHKVDFLFSDNVLKRMGANDFRRLLGFGKLKSTHFQVSQTWQSILFVGRGFGHGVGMCQWGAQRWARKGKTFRTILQHYYPGAQLIKIERQGYQAYISF